MMNSEERLDKLVEQLTKTNGQLVEYVTVLRRHIGEQEKLNNHLLSANKDHDERLRDVEQFRAVMDATLPKTWLNPQEVNEQLTALQSQITDMKLLLAKWVGSAVAVVGVAQLILIPLAKVAIAKIFGVIL